MRVQRSIEQQLSEAWLGLSEKEIQAIDFNNPFKPQEGDEEYFGISPLRVIKNPNYIMYAGKTLLNIEFSPIQAAAIFELWNSPFPMLIGSRGFSKTSSMAYYCILKMALTPKNAVGGPGVQIIITGAGFRQAKQVFEYMEGVTANSPVLRSLCDDDLKRMITRENDRYSIRIGPNVAHAIPLGDGSRVRGLRGNIVIADEFNSITPEIFETVIQGFGAVAKNPMEKVKQRAAQKLAKELGVAIPIGTLDQNQIIISGTCGYEHEHFATYWKRYKDIIECKGDKEKLQNIFVDGVPERFNWKNYSIIRVPYDKIPDGFLDDDIVARANATLHKGIFQNEYCAIFSKDSDGFFKRTLIDSCVASDKNINGPHWPPWCPVPFDVAIRGDSSKKYVIAVDPASEIDNFAIVVIEIWGNHRRVVYCWTTNKKQHKAAMQAGITKENDFYAYCARTIRQLRQAFPCDRIAIDGQGGGIGVIEALHNKNNLLPEDQDKLLWPIIDPNKPADTDAEPGDHIIEVCQFARAEWVAEANNGLRQDMEGKTLLFPRFDSVSLELASTSDRIRQAKYENENPGADIKIYNTVEDCALEMEELKNELTSIIHSRTGTGVNMRDRWDTPETKTPGGKKGRFRKDRYSALLMANMVARQMSVVWAVAKTGEIGGVLMDMTGGKDDEIYRYAPDNIKQAMQQFFDELG